jgi:drug/metabolite transporter (DMT)-like permease
MNTKSNLDGLAILALLVLCLSWGGQQVAIKIIADEVSPVMQASIRSIGAMVLVGSWMLARGIPLFRRDGTFWWGVTAGMLFAFEFMLIYWALEFTSASRAIIFIYLAPFVVAIGSQVFIPGEKLSPIQYLGLGCAFLGIVFAFGESLSFPSRRMLIGDTMLVVAAILWGATTLVIKAGPLINIPASRTLLYQLVVSALILPIGSAALGEPGVVRVTPLALASLAYQTVWIASITYLAWFWLIQRYSAPKLASFTFVTPIFGVLAGWLILGEEITSALLFAMVLVAAGVYLVNRPERNRVIALE